MKDDAIVPVASTLKLKGKIVVHTSGSVSMDVLKKRLLDNIGVFYAPHSFAGNKPLPKEVPFCIEASNAKVKKSWPVW